MRQPPKPWHRVWRQTERVEWGALAAVPRSPPPLQPPQPPPQLLLPPPRQPLPLAPSCAGPGSCVPDLRLWHCPAAPAALQPPPPPLLQTRTGAQTGGSQCPPAPAMVGTRMQAQGRGISSPCRQQDSHHASCPGLLVQLPRWCRTRSKSSLYPLPFIMSHQLLVRALLREAPIPQHHHMISRGQVLQLVGHQDARGLRRGAAAENDVRLNARC